MALELNLLLMSTLKSKFLDKECPEVYIDYLNLGCLLGGVRNGVHLDNIHNEELIDIITTDLHALGYDFNTRFETTIWHKRNISRDQVLHSWAYKGDSAHLNDPEYWHNTGTLLGNVGGYPTFTMDPEKRGSWSLMLTLNYNGKTCYPVSMMGGCYDKTIAEDLRSVEIIRDFLYRLIGILLYNPDDIEVYLESVELEIK